MALVTESEGTTSFQKVENEPQTIKELQTKQKAQKVALKATALDLKKAKTEQSSMQPARGFKRPQWCDAEQMTAVFCGEAKKIDVELADSWQDVKKMACDAFDIDTETHVLNIVFDEPVDRVVKKKPRPARVGELNVWDSVLHLKPREKFLGDLNPVENGPDSSSSSSNDSD